LLIRASVFSFQHSCDHPRLHSFPTRRSSDLFAASRSAPTDFCVSATSRPKPYQPWPWVTARRYAGGVRPPTTIGIGFCTGRVSRSEEHTSELQSRSDLVCRLLLEKKKKVKSS